MYLFIDTSHENLIILKLLTRDEVLDTSKVSGDRKVTERLLSTINEFIGKHSIVLSELEGIIAVNGPGAFTSLRITATVVNTIKQLNKVPVFSANQSELDTDEKILNSTSKVSLEKKVEPFYDREPNITLAGQ